MTPAMLISIVGLVVSTLAVCGLYLQLSVQNKQRILDVLESYERRFNEILEELLKVSHHVYDTGFTYRTLNDVDQRRVLEVEEKLFTFFFNKWLRAKKQKLLPTWVWNDWDKGIRSAMKYPFHREMWLIIKERKAFMGFEDFKTYIDSTTQATTQRT